MWRVTAVGGGALLGRYVREVVSSRERRAAARARVSADVLRGYTTPDDIVALASETSDAPKPPPPSGPGAASATRDPANPDGIPWELLARVREVFAEPSASVWCTSHNQTLGTRPVNAWGVGREQDVRNLLDALADGVMG